MYSYNERVSYSRVDENLELNYFGLVNYMQDCSCFHSEDVGVGLSFLTPRMLGWFVVNYEIHVIRMPRYSERIVISTYPYEVKGMMAHRIYTISAEDGTLLVYADSLWVLMNLSAGRPARITEEMKTAYADSGQLPQLEFEGGKLHAAQDAAEVGTFTVSEMYIDTNGHMNNSRYIDATSRFLPEPDFTSIRIDYKKPAQLNDELTVSLAQIEGGYQILLSKDDAIYTIVEYKK